MVSATFSFNWQPLSIILKNIFIYLTIIKNRVKIFKILRLDSYFLFIWLDILYICYCLLITTNMLNKCYIFLLFTKISVINILIIDITTITYPDCFYYHYHHIIIIFAAYEYLSYILKSYFTVTFTFSQFLFYVINVIIHKTHPVYYSSLLT